MDKLKKLLGKRIKELRTSKKYSQEKLAELAFTDQKIISNIECGNSFPTKYLLNIQKALGVSLSELFDFDHLDVDVSFMKKYIIKNIDNISDDEIVILYRVLKSMI